MEKSNETEGCVGWEGSPPSAEDFNRTSAIISEGKLLRKIYFLFSGILFFQGKPPHSFSYINLNPEGFRLLAVTGEGRYSACLGCGGGGSLCGGGGGLAVLARMPGVGGGGGRGNF